MSFSRETRLFAGITLLSVPTLVWGGLTLLAVLTQMTHGVPWAPATLSPTAAALYRAGHAHGGVLLILGLVIQIFLDGAHLSRPWRFLARICAPAGAVLISGGFFGIAHTPALAPVLYLGVGLLVLTVLVAGVGLVRAPT